MTRVAVSRAGAAVSAPVNNPDVRPGDRPRTLPPTSAMRAPTRHTTVVRARRFVCLRRSWKNVAPAEMPTA